MKNLQAIVVGAGIGGLQAALALASDGHKVTVLESAQTFEDIGAGIRVPPNSSKLSISWGVDFGRVKKEVSRGNRFVDWKGTNLLDCPFDDVESRYGAPYYFTHRADLVRLLVETAKENSNIVIRMSCRVSSYDFEAPSVTLMSGETLQADLVICADGIKSAIRDLINGRPIPPQDTGDVAYRILVPAAPLLADPEMRHLVEEPWAVHWMGPEGHAVGYPLRGGELYNIIIDVTHGSDSGAPVGEAVWKSARSNAELVARFRDWCPEVRRLCAMTGEYLKWKLADFDSLDRWVHPSGRAVLLGDACHPMMPHVTPPRAKQLNLCVIWRECIADVPNNLQIHGPGSGPGDGGRRGPEGGPGQTRRPGRGAERIRERPPTEGSICGEEYQGLARVAASIRW